MSEDLKIMVWLSKRELTFLLDQVDAYANGEQVPGEPLPEIVGDIRERLVLARYGKLKRTEIPAIRAGRRVRRQR